MGNCCKMSNEVVDVHVDFQEPHEMPKRLKTNPLTEEVRYDNSLVEFPLDNGKTRMDYCPFRCGICLLGILKEDARCASCVSHVFHSSCLTEWEVHCMEAKNKTLCPVCKVEGKSDWIDTDEEFSKNKRT